jgi:TolA-binding protein
MILRVRAVVVVWLLGVMACPQADEPACGAEPSIELRKGTLTELLEAVLPLPDDGPRETAVEDGPEAVLFRQGVTAFQRRAYGEAIERFTAFLKNWPNSRAVSAARAYLADATASAESGSRGQSDAIDIYRTVTRDFASSANASRAEWRIGDLYFGLGWYYEAQAAYERALARAGSPFDADRALLGMGLALMALGKWSDAEQTFQHLRRRTGNEDMLMRATLAQATTLYQQQRLHEAQPLFDASHRRWPAFVKRDPASLLRFADTLMATGQGHAARDVLAEFYNLYPAHHDAPSALVKIGDLFLEVGLRRQAEIFYAWVLTAHSGSPSEPVAQMRLVQVGQALAVAAGGKPLRLLVEASMRRVPPRYFDPDAQRQILREIVAQHRDSVLASEAQFRLGEQCELARDWPGAVREYQTAVARAGRIEGDPWPEAAARRIGAILGPWLASALKAGDDLTAVTLFHRHGPLAHRVYLGNELLLRVADAHRRLGFHAEAVRLYQILIREPGGTPFAEEALMGLGKAYLAQQDPSAARTVIARYRFQYPLGRYAEEATLLLVQAMLRQGDRDNVIRFCREWLRRHRRHPDRPRMLTMLATALAEARRTGEAIPIYDEAWRAGALGSAGALLRFGTVLVHERRYDRAAAVYRQALAAQPRPDEARWAWWQLARIAVTQGRSAEARTWLAKAAEAGDPLLRRVAVAMRRHLPPEAGQDGG